MLTAKEKKNFGAKSRKVKGKQVYFIPLSNFDSFTSYLNSHGLVYGYDHNGQSDMQVWLNVDHSKNVLICSNDQHWFAVVINQW